MVCFHLRNVFLITIAMIEGGPLKKIYEMNCTKKRPNKRTQSKNSVKILSCQIKYKTSAIGDRRWFLYGRTCWRTYNVIEKGGYVGNKIETNLWAHNRKVILNIYCLTFPAGCRVLAILNRLMFNLHALFYGSQRV